MSFHFPSAGVRSRLVFVAMVFVCLNAMGADNGLTQGLVVLEETGTGRRFRISSSACKLHWKCVGSRPP